MAETYYKKPMSIVRYDENGLKYLELMPTIITNNGPNYTDYSSVQDMSNLTNNIEQERKWYTAENTRKMKKAFPIVAKVLTGPTLLYGAMTGLAGSIAESPTLWGKATQLMASSMIGGEAVNKISKKVTGKNWGQNINNITKGYVPAWVGEFTNPGYSLAAPISNVGNKILGESYYKAALRARDVAYDNITPLGYTDMNIGPHLKTNKKKELVLAIKDYVTPKRVNPNVESPKWMQRIENNPDYDPLVIMEMSNSNGAIRNQIRLGDLLDFRNLAWRKAMRLKGTTDLYLSNGDGTYSYNMDVINPKLKLAIVDPNSGKLTGKLTGKRGWNGKIGHTKKHPNFDSITGNGGGVDIVTENGLTYMKDVWDLLPFKHEDRTLNLWVTKNLPFMRNFEAVKFLGGDPFVLKHPIPNQ